MNYTQIQNEVIKKYRIDLCDGSKCKDGDWNRTHAHIRERRVCKWKQENTRSSTFTLFHEIGHIETTKGKMRRAESEYYATAWAIDRFKEYGITIPQRTLFAYQRYIILEKARGQRRGGKELGELNLYKYAGLNVSEEQVFAQCTPQWQAYINGCYY